MKKIRLFEDFDINSHESDWKKFISWLSKKDFSSIMIYDLDDIRNKFMEVANLKNINHHDKASKITSYIDDKQNRVWPSVEVFQYLDKLFMDDIADIDEKFNLEKINESLPRQKSVDQLKALRKLTKGVDIGDRIPDLMKQGANIHYSRNVIDSGIESYEDFEKNNKNFVSSWNLKHLMNPFKNKNKK